MVEDNVVVKSVPLSFPLDIYDLLLSKGVRNTEQFATLSHHHPVPSHPCLASLITNVSFSISLHSLLCVNTLIPIWSTTITTLYFSFRSTLHYPLLTSDRYSYWLILNIHANHSLFFFLFPNLQNTLLKLSPHSPETIRTPIYITWLFPQRNVQNTITPRPLP